MKKTLVVLTLVLATGGVALADGNGGPQTPNSAFLVWQQQGAKGQPMTSLAELNGQARPTEVAEQPTNVIQR